MRSRAAVARTVWVATLAAAGLSCSAKSKVEKPSPPDMTGLVQSYDQPTLALDPTSVEAAFDASVSVSSTVKMAVNLVPQVEEVVHAGLNANGEQSQIGSSGDKSDRPIDVTGSGFLRVHRICPGASSSSGPDEANGSIDLIVGFTEKGIDPVVWGSFHACQMRIADELQTLQGALNLYVGENLAFDMFGSQPIVVQMTGTLAAAGGAGTLDVDFRIMPTGAFEYRVFVGDDHAVYWDDLESRGFRAANGVWTCQFDEHLCTRNDDAQQLVW